MSVVVATHNRARRLQELLDALRRQTIGAQRFEVIVVDDGSSDETPAVLAGEAARGELVLRALRNERALGPAGARQAGWREGSAPVVAFTDDDCAPTPTWLEVGLARLAEPEVIVQGATLPNPSELANLGPFSRTIEVTALHPAFNTCNIFYSRELLQRIGGFDTESFDHAPGGEDCDLAWRAIGVGARPVFARDAVVHHAVDHVGALGMFKVAGRWTTPMKAYARHPGLRETFSHGIFWKREHYLLARGVLALLAPRLPLLARLWLAFPYARNLWSRGRVLGGGPALAPYYVALDAVETFAVARGGLRYRRLML